MTETAGFGLSGLQEMAEIKAFYSKRGNELQYRERYVADYNPKQECFISNWIIERTPNANEEHSVAVTDPRAPSAGLSNNPISVSALVC